MSKIGNAGKVYLMPEISRPCSLAMNLFLIRLDERKVTNKYVYHYLKTCSGGTQIQSRLNGVATQTITKENVRSLQIPVCSHDKQISIVSSLEKLSAETQRLESIYQQKLAALDTLKKSLLDQAFTGAL
jgi:type I restriction enzyme S subunit